MSSSDGQNTSSCPSASHMVNGTHPQDAQVAPSTTVRDFGNQSSTSRTLMSIEAARIRDAVADSYFAAQQRAALSSAATTPRPASSGRTFPHGSRYRWGTDWAELFSSSESEKADWDSPKQESSESEEIEYYDFSRRRPPLVNGHRPVRAVERREAGGSIGRGDEFELLVFPPVQEYQRVEDRPAVSPAASDNGHASEDDDADCEDEDGEEDAQSQDSEEQERAERRQEDRQSSPEDQLATPRPQPRGEWYDATRDGTIWNAGLNGTG